MAKNIMRSYHCLVVFINSSCFDLGGSFEQGGKEGKGGRK